VERASAQTPVHAPADGHDHLVNGRVSADAGPAKVDARGQRIHDGALRLRVEVGGRDAQLLGAAAKPAADGARHGERRGQRRQRRVRGVVHRRG